MVKHRDPVCGMEIEAEDAAGTSEFESRKYYFCNPGCKTAFDQNPRKYLGSERKQDDRRPR